MRDIVDDLKDAAKSSRRQAASAIRMNGATAVMGEAYQLDKAASLHETAAAEIERLQLSISEALAQRDAAFEMSKCECGPDEACRNLVEARLSGRIAGLEEAARIADDMPLVRHVTENLGGLPPLLLCNTPKDVSAAIRAAMEPKP